MSRGRRRTISYDGVIAYAVKHPLLLQSEIAKVFNTTQSRISYILCQSGVRSPHRGRPLKQRPGQTDEQYRWETMLHNFGLGMDRGLRMEGKRILYGYDPLKERPEDGSATSSNE